MDYEHRIRCEQLTVPVKFADTTGDGDGDGGEGGDAVLVPMSPRSITSRGPPSRLIPKTAMGAAKAMAKGSAAQAAAPLRAALRRDRGRLEQLAAADITLRKMVTAPLTSMAALSGASSKRRSGKIATSVKYPVNQHAPTAGGRGRSSDKDHKHNGGGMKDKTI